MRKNPYQVLQKPVITEKGLEAKERARTLCFRVDRHANKSEIKQAGANPARFLREVPLGAGAEVKVGDKVLVDQFAVNDYVDVTGTSKGRGFAGFHKRHHFGGGGAAHGSMFHRAPGSIGSSAFPSRVFKGMRAAGHMGVDRVTVRNLKVVQVLSEENALLVRGAVPGPDGAYVIVRKAKAARRKPAAKPPIK